MARLALAGGTPVRTQPFTRWPDFDEIEWTLLLEARDWGGYPFPNTFADRFASEFAAAHDVRHAFAVANGTIAIEVALKAAGLRPGDEVILPAYTFEATAAPVLRLEAVPVFVDVLPTTWCLVEAIEKIRRNVDELRSAEHRLVQLESMSRADRDRAAREA